MKRRTFSAELKAKIVLEVLRGEKEISAIASEYEIAPNQIRNWKAEFLKNAAAAFDDRRVEDLKEELQEKERETGSLYKKIGQLTTQVDWLKKKSEEVFGLEWESKYTPRPKDK
jgi:transposase-like protein